MKINEKLNNLTIFIYLFVIPWLSVDLFQALLYEKTFKLRINGYFFLEEEPFWFVFSVGLKLVVLVYVTYKLVMHIKEAISFNLGKYSQLVLNRILLVLI